MEASGNYVGNLVCINDVRGLLGKELMNNATDRLQVLGSRAKAAERELLRDVIHSIVPVFGEHCLDEGFGLWFRFLCEHWMTSLYYKYT